MSPSQIFVKSVGARSVAEIKNGLAFSICTVVNNLADYERMIKSFVRAGFTREDCEYLYADNSRGNVLDAFAAYNRFFVEAKGEYLILCHQDIELLSDDRTTLEKRLRQLDEADDLWALCGNAGGTADGRLHVRITDRWGVDQHHGPFPARVVSLDENFIVAKRHANLAVSRDLFGFHFYGADLCTIARVLGWNSYVVDFHVRHTGKGSIAQDFFEIRDRLEEKYSRAFKKKWIKTTTSKIVVGAGAPLLLINRVRRRLSRSGIARRT